MKGSCSFSGFSPKCLCDSLLDAAFGFYTETSPENLEVSRIKLPVDSYHLNFIHFGSEQRYTKVTLKTHEVPKPTRLAVSCLKGRR